MSKEWNASCKDCGRPFGYSDTSYVAGMQRGFSRPERCPECRKRHAREIQSVGMPFFKVKPINPASIVDGVQAGVLGKIEHPPREHVDVELPSSLDTSKFGITEAKLYELFEKLEKNQIVVVVGPTGSGKSTYLPYRLMVPPDGIDPQVFTRYGQILVTQPRIQAARNIPGYVAKVMHGSSIGAGFDIGFRHSNAPASDWRCKLVYVTDGTLINWIVTGQISNLSVIMIDEAHERSLNIDLILGLLKRLLPRYPRLKLVVASATIDHEKFINYFGGENNVGFVEFEGKSYGVTEHYRDDLGKPPLAYDPQTVPQLAKNIYTDVAEQILDLLKRMYLDNGDLHHKRGDILAFLHGVQPIEQAVAVVKKGVEEIPELADFVDVLPLYTTLPQSKQDEALGKPEWMKELEKTHGYESLSPSEQEEAVRRALYGSRRRVVISTNVAETSLTVHGILHVVDCGLINQDAWDAETQTTVVAPVLHSRAGCRQRWGRAGRLMAGDAYCLYTREQFSHVFPGYSLPQILRAPLEQVVLTAKAAGIDDLRGFPWIDPPDATELERARTILIEKNALDADGDLTEHGLELQSFSEEPNLANMMVLADRFGCAIEMATLVPIMKLGGYGRLLRYERDWDANTRRSVRRIHRALIEKCEDDIELCLKLYAAWSQANDDETLSDTWAFRQVWPHYMPGLPAEVRHRLGKAETQKLTNRLLKAASADDLIEIVADAETPEMSLDGWLAQAVEAIVNARPAAWARLFFANHNVFSSKVEVEREKLIDALSAHKKEDERRALDFDLLTRLRLIFAYALPERVYHSTDRSTMENDRIYQPIAYVGSQPDVPAVVGRYSICYQREVEAFVCSKQQTIRRKLTADSEPTLVMMVSFLAKINPRWVPRIFTFSPIELGHYIAGETRESENGALYPSGIGRRLMIDQRYPLDSRFACRIRSQNLDKRVLVQINRRLAGPPPIQEVNRSGEAAIPEEDYEASIGGELLVNTALDDADVITLDPDDDMDPAWVDLAQEGRDLLAEDLVCSNCRTPNDYDSYYCRDCGARLEDQSQTVEAEREYGEGWLLVGEQGRVFTAEVKADVVDFDVTETGEPKPVLRLTPDPEPFLAFTQLYREGDRISVTVAEHDTYPGDYLVALVVRESQSGLEIVMEPSDVVFANRSYGVQAIPIGVNIQATVEAIDVEFHRVQLSLLPYVEDHLNELLARTRSRDNRYELPATVGEVHEVWGKVYFTLEPSEPSKGIVHVVGIGGNRLAKPAQEHQVGERHNLQLWFSDRPSYVALARLPDEIEARMEKERIFDRLSWEDGRLYFNGRMTYSLQTQLRNASDDAGYRKAINDLYRFTNDLSGKWSWPDDLAEKYKVGTQVKGATVLRLAPFGAFVELEPGVEGLLHKSEMSWGNVNPEDVVAVGDEISVRVISFDPEQQRIGLSIRSSQDNPFVKYKVGDCVTGTVKHVESYGAFVEITPGVSGLVHIKEIKWGYVSNIHDEVKVGDEVRVKIIDVDLSRRRFAFSMKQA